MSQVRKVGAFCIGCPPLRKVGRQMPPLPPGSAATEANWCLQWHITATKCTFVAVMWICTWFCSLSKCDWFVSDLQANWTVPVSFSHLRLLSRLSWRQRWSQLQSVSIQYTLYIYRVVRKKVSHHQFFKKSN